MLLDMRRQRVGLIQTPDQLRFSYQAIMDGVSYLLNMEEPEGPGDVSYSEGESEKEEDEPPPIPPRDPDLTGPTKPKEAVVETVTEREDDEEKLLKRTKSMPDEEPPHKREKLDTMSGEATGETQPAASESEGSSEWELINGTEEPQNEEPQNEEQQEEKELEEPTDKTTDERER